jgi:hypothetical protein
MKTSRIALLLFLISCLVACKKDEVVGPQGPQGPSGATGPQGNANIITIIDTSDASWWTSFGSNNTNWKALIDVPQITQGIVDSGVVLVYQYSITANSNYGWVLLPYGLHQQYSWNVFYFLNTVEINYYLASLNSPNPGAKIFKIVIMDGYIMRQNPVINWSDDTQVAKFNLKD